MHNVWKSVFKESYKVRNKDRGKTPGLGLSTAPRCTPAPWTWRMLLVKELSIFREEGLMFSSVFPSKGGGGGTEDVNKMNKAQCSLSSSCWVRLGNWMKSQQPYCSVFRIILCVRGAADLQRECGSLLGGRVHCGWDAQIQRLALCCGSERSASRISFTQKAAVFLLYFWKMTLKRIISKSLKFIK